MTGQNVSNNQVELSKIALYGILDTGYLAMDQFSAMAENLIAGGVGILQVRAKKESSKVRCQLVEQVLPVCMKAGIPLVINDDLSVATQFDSIGIHVGQEDQSSEEIRDILGPDRIIGLSSHSIEQATQAYQLGKRGTIDYFAIGPVFATQTKPDYVPVTLDLVHWAIEQGFDIPHFFIGGINRLTLPQVLEVGAKQVVVVSDLLLADDPCAVAKEMVDLIGG